MKKRLVAGILTGLFCILLGSCNGVIPSQSATPKIQMQVQEYESDNIVEIPKFSYAGFNDALMGLNSQLSGFVKRYEEFKSKSDEVALIEIKTYPFTTKKYVQIVMTSIEFPNYATDGDIVSFNYNVSKRKQEHLTDAMDALDMDTKVLTDKFTQYFEENGEEPGGMKSVVKSVEESAFRYTKDNHIELYIKVLFDNPQTDFYNTIYTYHSKEDTFSFHSGEQLVDPTEADHMNPPLNYDRLK